jgi:ATP-dependent Zn protease
MAILKHHARNVPYDPINVDMSVIARATPGYSGAELEALVNQVRRELIA